jgi:hypothetical protein
MTHPVEPTPIPPAAALAEGAAEAIRGLSHATRAADLQPADVYRVLGSLGSLAARLPQAIAQLSAILGRSLAAGGLIDERGGDPARAVAVAAVSLAEAGAFGDRLAHQLGLAHEAIAFVSTAQMPSTSGWPTSTAHRPVRQRRQL